MGKGLPILLQRVILKDPELPAKLEQLSRDARAIASEADQVAVAIRQAFDTTGELVPDCAPCAPGSQFRGEENAGDGD